MAARREDSMSRKTRAEIDRIAAELMDDPERYEHLCSLLDAVERDPEAMLNVIESVAKICRSSPTSKSLTDEFDRVIHLLRDREAVERPTEGGGGRVN
jgi:hypothetical protein